jgi:predicted nucleic acid-binding Zn ribbon protein
METKGKRDRKTLMIVFLVIALAAVIIREIVQRGF